MDSPSSFKKSFRRYHSEKISVGQLDEDRERQPILTGYPMLISSSENLDDRHEVILKIDDSSLTKNHVNAPPQHGTDPLPESAPTMLIDEFLKNQQAAGDQFTFDVMNEMNSDNDTSARPSNLNDRVSYSKETRVSFANDGRESSSVVDIEADVKQGNDMIKKEDDSLSDDDDDDEGGRNRSFSGDDRVLRCTSFQRRDSRILARQRTKSRLMDSPDLPPVDRKSGKIQKSGTMRSGILSRTSGMLGDEEDDPLFDEDLPDEFRKGKVGVLLLLEWLSLICIVTALVCSLSISMWKKKVLRGLELWKWEVLTLVVICGRLVSDWVIRIAVFFIEMNFMLRKRFLYFVYGVRKAVQNCLWLGLVLIAWQLIFDKRVEDQNKFLQLVNKIMVCMVVATLLWLIKTLMVKVLASSFHVSRFFDRIQEALFTQYVIVTLSGPPLIEINRQQYEDNRALDEVRKFQNAGAVLPPGLKATAFRSPVVSGRLVGGPPVQKQLAPTLSFRVSGPISSKNREEQAISIDHLHKLNPKNISAWNMKRLMNIVRYGTLSTLDEQVLGGPFEDETTKQIKSEREAKVAARKIFRNVAKPGAKFIYPEDLMRFLREDEAFKAISNAEDSSQSTKISKVSLKNWVVNTFRERRALALTLNDTKTAVKKLHQMVNVLVAVIILIICLVILELATSKVLLFMSSQVVLMAFIFGNTCKTAFEALIFLFVMHPFDVGDRCEIDGVQMIVEEMNILNTIFLRWDNEKIMFPNSTLSMKPIGNYNRSPDMYDTVDFAVHITTPAEKIALMKQRITSYIDNKKDYWYSSPTIVLLDLHELKTVKFSVWMRHQMNHQDMGERYARRSILIEEMIKIFKELDIEYRLYPLDINIRSMPPPTSTRVPTTWQAP